jgi:hypothetical protein
MKPIRPARPQNLDPIASEMLARLQVVPEASKVVIGGGVAIAKAQVARRLSDIELRRPLASLEPRLRGDAEPLRAWVRDQLVGQPFEAPAPNLSVDLPRGPEPLEHERGGRQL